MTDISIRCPECREANAKRDALFGPRRTYTREPMDVAADVAAVAWASAYTQGKTGPECWRAAIEAAMKVMEA